MYLQRIRDWVKRHGGYPPAAMIDKHELEVAHTVIDADLNSWKEAHTAFEAHQKGKKEVTPAAHRAFTNLVQQAAAEEGQRNWATRYVAEIIAYFVLRDWIFVRG